MAGQSALLLAAQHAKDKAEREAAERAAKLAQEQARQAEQKAKSDYLAQLRRGLHLRARKCPDGEGNYYVVGLLPAIKPRPVACIDVNFRASCPGNVAATENVSKDFLGASTDCFMGDATKIEPKPACAVEQVRVDVTNVQECR